jgi:hypothetical protein
MAGKGDKLLAPAGLSNRARGRFTSKILATHLAVKFGLMVGIGGIIPSDDNDIRRTRALLVSELCLFSLLNIGHVQRLSPAGCS